MIIYYDSTCAPCDVTMVCFKSLSTDFFFPEFLAEPLDAAARRTFGFRGTPTRGTLIQGSISGSTLSKRDVCIRLCTLYRTRAYNLQAAGDPHRQRSTVGYFSRPVQRVIYRQMAIYDKVL